MKHLITAAFAVWIGIINVAQQGATDQTTRELTDAEWQSIVDETQKVFRDDLGLDIPDEAVLEMWKGMQNTKPEGGLLGPGFGQ